MNLYELMVKIGADSTGLKTGISKASTIVSGFAKATGVALGAAATAVTAVTKQAVSAYANYEQLIGGVETLFGEASDTVKAFAEDAFKTAGMSANDYMETITSFAKALEQSTGGDTEAAANKANTAISDMADNANKMGTTMESIQNAYQGFAKQNYTMLDNLKLGYGGTKSEMERLLADAEELTGVDYNVESYGDIVDAIHAIQTEAGISGLSEKEAAEMVAQGLMTEEEAYDALGTTAKEARSTITGSLGMMKASWENWLTALGRDDVDISDYTNQLVDSATTFADNVMPVIGQVFESLSSTFVEDFPGIVQEAAGTLTEKAPELAGAGAQLLASLISGLLTSLPDLIASIPEIVSSIGEAFSEAFGDGSLLEAGKEIGKALLDAVAEAFGADGDTVLSDAQEFIQKIVDWFTGAVETIKGVWEDIVAFVTPPIESIVGAATAAWELITTVWEGIVPIFENIWNNISTAANAVWPIISTYAQVAWRVIQAVWNLAVPFFTTIWDSIAAVFSVVESVLSGDFQGAWAAIQELASTWVEFFSELWEEIKDVFSDANDIGYKLIDDIKAGISAAWTGLVEWFQGIWDSVFGNLTAHVSITSSDNTGGSSGPSKKSGSSANRANGLDYVPYNGMPATLHRGEAVLTANEASAWRAGKTGGGNTINIYPQTLDNATVDYLFARFNAQMGAAV